MELDYNIEQDPKYLSAVYILTLKAIKMSQVYKKCIHYLQFYKFVIKLLFTI